MSRTTSKASLQRLRTIGFRLWDPIGLCGLFEEWEDSGFEDEYDKYLVEVAKMLREKATHADIVSYLYHVETNWMGLAEYRPYISSENQARLLKVVQAISDGQQSSSGVNS